MTREQLVASLKTKGVLRSAVIERALRTVDRKKFVADEHKTLAYDDIPLPIGAGQTVSQPYTVVFMLELLRPRRAEHIIDVGAGSGWQACLLADIVGPEGRVYAMERLPTLCELGKKNIAKFPDLRERIEFFCKSARQGIPGAASRIGGFDAIIAAAEVPEIPGTWRRQLKPGGRLVYPKSGSVFREIKDRDGGFSADEYPGFAFVPFIP